MRRRLAFALWIAWAVLLWNVVFDHVIIVAGRNYIAAADRAFAQGIYENMDVWMRPAVSRAFWIASASAAAVLGTGAILGRLTKRTTARAS